MQLPDIFEQQANSEAKIKLFSDLNCPFCFAMHERVSQLQLHSRINWCLIEHAPSFNSEIMTEEQRALLEHEFSLIQQRAKDVEIQRPGFCVNTHLAILTYIHIEHSNALHGQKFLQAIYQAYWCSGLDISDQQVIHDILVKLGLADITINPSDGEQQRSWQSAWKHGDFDLRIPAMVAPDKQIMLGLQHEESIKGFIQQDSSIEITQGQTCLHHGSFNIALLTATAFSDALKQFDSEINCHSYNSVNLLIEDNTLKKFDGLVICFQSDMKSNFSCIRKLKNKIGAGLELPVVYISDHYDSRDEVQAFALGANDFIRYDSGLPAISARLNQVLNSARTIKLLHRHASIDGLTGILNKREFKRSLEQEWRNACRNQLELSIIMIDIDYFKNYNDSQGHCAGDTVLQTVARTLGINLYRAKDILARFGGEEFVVLLPETNLEGLEFVCQQLRHNVEEKKIEHPESQVSDYITISIGGCYAKPHADQSALDFIELADTALYQAKGNGRNQYYIKIMDTVSYD